MTRFVCLAIAGFAVAGVLTAGPARAQVACDSLPNPIVVTGSVDFEPTLKEFAVRMAAETPPATIITVAAGGQATSTSCGAVAGLVAGMDFGGLPGRTYVRAGTTIEIRTCTFPAGQSAHVAISEVFYESCTAAPQPRPADVADVLGPVQPTMLVAYRSNTSTYLGYDEARTIFGCGVSITRAVAGVFKDPRWIFCRDASAGTQITLATNLGIPDAVFPACRFYSNDEKLVFDMVPRPGGDPPYMPEAGTLGFVAGRAFDRERGDFTPLAFQARGQDQAYYPDSSLVINDRKNVRDGHYPLWGYIHFITRTTGGNVSPRASELIGWVNGTKSSPNIDPFALVVGARLIPQCAMKAKRSSDGGPLGPYSAPGSCHCAFEAAASLSLPAGCTPCASNSTCPCGTTCRHGFCEK